LPKVTVVVLGWVLTVATAIGIAYIITGYPMQESYDDRFTAGLVPDVLHERVTGWEAIHGNPYRPVGDIMVDHGYPSMAGGMAVRTPGAFLLQTPLAHVPDSTLLLVTVSGVLISLVVCLALSIKISHINPRVILWLGPAFFVSFPAVTAMGFGSVMVLIPVTLVLLGWTFRDQDWSGVAIGLAASSRLWPALIIIGLWLTGRRKAAVIAVATFVVATALGLALPGVTVSGTIEALSTGGSYWITNPQNVSLAHVFDAIGINSMVALIVAVLAGLALALRYRRDAFSITVITALIASPLSWPAYTIVALPAMMERIGRSRPILLATIAFPWVGWVLVPSDWRGYAFFGSLVLLLILVAIEPIEHEKKLTWSAASATPMSSMTAEP
jgi:hypothetical protein